MGGGKDDEGRRGWNPAACRNSGGGVGTESSDEVSTDKGVLAGGGARDSVQTFSVCALAQVPARALRGMLREPCNFLHNSRCYLRRKAATPCGDVA